jgi:hypothetical protein
MPTHDVGAIHCAILDASSLSATSRQPLIYSYGWIRTADTIILPACLILSSNRNSSMRYAWALLVQPVDLNTLVPQTRNVTNRCPTPFKWFLLEFLFLSFMSPSMPSVVSLYDATLSHTQPPKYPFK